MMFTKAQEIHDHHGHTNLPKGPTAGGAIAWCKRCGRKHPRRMECNLVWAERIAKSGRKVMRLVHPTPRAKSRKKTKARRG
jgi:hypothetical protein